MADVSNELIFEVLKQVQQRLDKVDELKSEMNAMRGYLISMQQDVQNVYGILDRYDGRLEHIERRLELNDSPTMSA
ncbi:hypothetical protein RPPS3_38470 [Rhodopseudomonas palustris]|uniref:hypothetical protein n=1 Tax=Rhodopseudomonas palustris TaxID=1076 RepID=UPI000D1BFD74|nr:hypothetical protein [Rhodopseudomonas palustris]AVT77909.1 hypothetical protein RPPS3_38470 [Rhodopseudomonas palustris]